MPLKVQMKIQHLPVKDTIPICDKSSRNRHRICLFVNAGVLRVHGLYGLACSNLHFLEVLPVARQFPAALY